MQSGETALHFAATKGLEDIAQTLLSLGADISIKNNGGDTALHFAAGRGSITIVQLLIDKLKKSVQDGTLNMDINTVDVVSCDCECLPKHH